MNNSTRPPSHSQGQEHGLLPLPWRKVKHKIEQTLDDTLRSSGVAAANIERVFLTGGTSLVPAVQQLFMRRFGEDRIEGGNELVSIAKGLALIAARDDAE